MFGFSTTKLTRIAVHNVGNASREEGFVSSHDEMKIESEIIPAVTKKVLNVHKSCHCEPNFTVFRREAKKNSEILAKQSCNA